MKAAAGRKISPAAPRAKAPPARRTKWWQRDALLAAAVFVLALGVFANSIVNGYAGDDTFIIQTNPHLNWPCDVKGIFGTSWSGGRSPDGLYRPLTLLSFALDWRLFGKDPPTGLHAMNILANGVIAVLVYSLVRRLWQRKDLAVLTAALYAIHPVHTEVVANGVGRAELYMMLTLLVAVHLHLTYAQRALQIEQGGDAAPNRPARRSEDARAAPCGYLWGAAGLFFISLLFKESAFALPVLLFLMDWLVLRNGRWPPVRRLAPYLVYVLALGVCFAVRIRAIGWVAPPPAEVMAYSTSSQRMLFASETLLRYIGQSAVPWCLCADYSDYAHPVRTTIGQPLVLASLAAWVACAAFVVWLLRRRQWLILFGTAWFFVSLLPVSNLIRPVGTIRADRLLFLPSLGFALIVAWLLVRLGGAQRFGTSAVALVILSLYAGRSILRNAEWRDQATLMTRTVQQNPGSAAGWQSLAESYAAAGELRRAADDYQTAYELRDAVGFFRADAHLGRAEMLDKLGDREGAIRELRLVLEHNPRYPSALINLGQILLDDPAHRAEAVELLERFTASTPNDYQGYAALAQAQQAIGSLAPALAAIENALRLQHGGPAAETRTLLLIKSDILAMGGNVEEAERVRQQGERLIRGGG